jgi:hypothetical protein
MTPTLAFASPASQTDGNSAETAASSHRPAPRLVSSSSLIVVMIVYVLFGAAGFFAAAQLI